MKTVGLPMIILVVTIINVTLFLIARSLWMEAHSIQMLPTAQQTAAPDMPAGSQHISYISPDGTGWRESIRIWGQFTGKDHIYHGILLDSTRWVLTNAGAISCDSPEASTGWPLLSNQERGEIVQACAQEWVRWMYAHAHTQSMWAGTETSKKAAQTIRCDGMTGDIWNRLSAERQATITAYCQQPERIWQPASFYPEATPMPTPGPTIGGPLRKLADGTWAYRPESGATWNDLTQAERDMLHLPPLCSPEWYKDPATAGTACPEALEFVANYTEYKAAFEADYIRRHGQQ